MRTRKLVVTFIAAMTLNAAGLPQARAIDLANAPVPTAVPDGRASLCDLALVLPPGEWTFVSREATTYFDAFDRAQPGQRAYLVAMRDGKFDAGVMFDAMPASMTARKWSNDPCGSGPAILRDRLDGTVFMPECLLVERIDAWLARSTAPVYLQLRDWMSQHAVANPSPVYHITYARYATNSFGLVRVHLPVTRFADDAAAVAWARQLPGRLKAWCERRESSATLPALP